MVRRAALTAFALVAVYVGCHEPTEMIVHVTTSFDCSLLGGNPVGIRFGTSAPLTGATSAVSKACASRDVGSLVLTPSARYDGQSLTVEAITALAPATLDGDGLCAEGTPGCIHARRSLPYLSGSAITVPIELQASCAGVPCAANETCVNAACVSSNVDPSQCKTDCSLGSDGGTDAGTDGPVADAGPTPAACGDMSGLLPKAALPMALYCPGHVGYSASYTGPSATPSITHTFPTGLTGPQMAVPAQVVIDENDDVYFLTLDGKLHAFSARTGSEKWPSLVLQATPLNQGLGSVVLASDGTIYAASDTQVFAVSRTTGKQTGVITVKNSVRSTLTPGPLGLYFSGPVAQIDTLKLNPLALWISSAQANAGIDGVAPMIVGGTVWVGDNLGEAVPYVASSLAPLTPVSLNQNNATPSTMSAAPDGTTMRTCYIGTGEGGSEGRVAAFGSSGVTWTKAAGSAVVCYIAAVLNDGTTLYTDDNRSLYAFGADGSTVTKYPGNGPNYPAADVNRVVYTLDAQGYLAAYSSPTQTLWSSAITINPWAIYVGTDHDLIAVMDSEIDVLK